jgi:hypothetical protein
MRGWTSGPAFRFGRHLAEMVIAMVAGMVLLGPLWTVAWPGLHDRPGVEALVMVGDMTLGMGLWMRVRGHSWASTGEMSAAMALPFLAMLVPYAAGLFGASMLMVAGHVVMLLGMVLAMFWKWDEYTGAHHHHHGRSAELAPAAGDRRAPDFRRSH